MDNKCVCGGNYSEEKLSPPEGFILYKYYSKSDTVEYFQRYNVLCDRCENCGGQQNVRVSLSIPETIPHNKEINSAFDYLTQILDGESYEYSVCKNCGGKLIADMAALGSSGNCLKKFSDEEFVYSIALFDVCADCGNITNIREKKQV